VGGQKAGGPIANYYPIGLKRFEQLQPRLDAVKGRQDIQPCNGDIAASEAAKRFFRREKYGLDPAIAPGFDNVPVRLLWVADHRNTAHADSVVLSALIAIAANADRRCGKAAEDDVAREYREKAAAIIRSLSPNLDGWIPSRSR
jgi:hypothetical protein